MGCKFLDRYVDQVPAPFGKGTISMPTAECRCDEAVDNDIDNCGPKCRHYQEESIVGRDTEPYDPDDPREAFRDDDPIDTFERQQEIDDQFGGSDPHGKG